MPYLHLHTPQTAMKTPNQNRTPLLSRITARELQKEIYKKKRKSLRKK